MKEEFECKICHRIFKSSRGLWQHLKYSHKGMTKKEYYDKYFKKDDIGICLVCSGDTKFDFRHFGYFTYCSIKCINKSSIIRQKIVETNLNRYGVTNNTQLDYYKKLNSDIYRNKTIEEKQDIRKKQKNTCMERYNVDNPGKSEMINQKMINTCLKKYGVKYALEDKDVIEKRKQTNIKLYGVENVFQNKEIINKIRKILIKKGYKVDQKDYTNFENFYKRCVSLTKINIRKSTFKQDWDGNDYYDNEYIKDNYDLYKPNNENYPNIDHKISIIYGFLNNMSVDDIASIDNLCFTKRKHNMNKFTRTEKDFIENKKWK
jgi:hypothetical protein